jgi:hypothetical protein
MGEGTFELSVALARDYAFGSILATSLESPSFGSPAVQSVVAKNTRLLENFGHTFQFEIDARQTNYEDVSHVLFSFPYTGSQSTVELLAAFGRQVVKTAAPGTHVWIGLARNKVRANSWMYGVTMDELIRIVSDTGLEFEGEDLNFYTRYPVPHLKSSGDISQVFTTGHNTKVLFRFVTGTVNT